MWYYHDGMWWWMVFGGIMMVVFWGAIIAFAVWGTRKLTDRGGSGIGTVGKRDPMDIAVERYARGEISREEYEGIKKTIS